MTEPGRSGGPVAADGRTPGTKGRATRQRLLEKTAETLQDVAYRDLAVVDIARAVDTSAGGPSPASAP